MQCATRTWLHRHAGCLSAMIIVIITSTGASADQTRPISFRHLTIADGLSQNTVMDVHQDAHGYIWFATEYGLDRYDGYSVHRYQRGQVSRGELVNDYIWQIIEDDNTDLWLATNGAGVAFWQRETDRFTHFRFDEGNPASLSSDHVRSLLLTDAGLWVGTLHGGLNLLDPTTGSVTRFQHDPSDPRSLPDDSIYALLEDPTGKIWVGTDHGLASLEPSTGRFTRFQNDPADPTSLSHDRIRALAIDRHDTLWVGTFGGGANALNPRSGRFTRYLADSSADGSLSHGHVWDIIEDDTGRVWIATAAGLNLLRPGSEQFETYRGSDQVNQLSDDYIMSLHQDRDGVLWVGTRAGGANTWNSRSWELGHRRPQWLEQRSLTSFASDNEGFWAGTMGGGLTYSNEITGAETHLSTTTTPAITDDRVMSLLLDSRGTLWIGTMEGGINKLSPDGQKVSVLRYDADDPASPKVTSVMSMFEDSAGRVWIGAFGGGAMRFNTTGGGRTQFDPDPNNMSSICGSQGRAFAEDNHGAIWIGTEKGLCFFDEAAGVFHSYRHDDADPNSLADDSVYALHVTPNGDIWVGTGGGGLSKMVGSSENPGDISFETISRKSGLSSNMIYAIEADNEGQLWLSSNNGLTRYNPESGDFRTYRSTQGLQGDEFHYGSSHSSKNGTLYFGGANGYNSFDPARLAEPEKSPPVVLTRISTMNQPLEPVNSTITEQVIQLDYQSPAITLEFAALDFTEPESNRYAYRLAGYDDKWVDADTRRTASYTNLSTGRYTFRVKAAGSAGNWNEDGLSIAIQVMPAPWMTTWAYATYVSILLVALWYYIRRNRQRMARESQYRINLESKVQERTEELATRNEELKKLTEIKSEFLARMSHEIRSPINGILGMTELLSRSNLDTQQKKFAHTISSSGQSLLHVINDILDYSKLEADMVQLEYVDTDLESLLSETIDMFALEASRKGLDFIVRLPPTGLPGVSVDRLRLKQVLVNLLTNAIKFTDHGHVALSINVVSEQDETLSLRFSVSDTGIGIAPENHQKIFDSFSQEDGSTTRRFGGTGLGLTICRDLLGLMHSNIQLDSKSERGSVFSFDMELQQVASIRPEPIEQMTGGVLIASQRSALSELVSYYLDGWGLRYTTASSAESALDILARPSGGTINALIIDKQLADFAGTDLLQSALARGLIDESQCIVMHGFDEHKVNAGRSIHISEPIKRQELLQSIYRAYGHESTELADNSIELSPQLIGRVLMVEDDPINQEVFAGMLAELGCDSTFAADGKTGLQLAASTQFDAILMDYQLPDINGAEVARGIRALDGEPALVPIIALTANATAEDEALCLAAGMNAFLTKPCPMSKLAETLSRWLPLAEVLAEPSQGDAETSESDGQFDELALARIRRLTRPDGSPMLEHAIELFLTTAGETLAAFRTASASGDADALRFGAHKLKSGCANLGAKSMADLCRQLEELGRSGSVQGAESLIEAIEEELANATDWLEEQLRESA